MTTEDAPPPIRQRINALGFDDVYLYTEGDGHVQYAGYRIVHGGKTHLRHFMYINEDMKAGAWLLVFKKAEELAEELGLIVLHKVKEWAPTPPSEVAE